MSKYNAKKTTIGAITFDSKAESEFYLELKRLERLGDVEILEIQPKIHLTNAKILYKPDFKVRHKSGLVEYIDVKGFQTAVFAIKKRLWAHYGPGVLAIIKKTKSGFKRVEEVHQKGTPTLGVVGDSVQIPINAPGVA